MRVPSDEAVAGSLGEPRSRTELLLEAIALPTAIARIKIVSPSGSGRDSAFTTSRRLPSACLACRRANCQCTDEPNALVANIGQQAGGTHGKVCFCVRAEQIRIRSEISPICETPLFPMRADAARDPDHLSIWYLRPVFAELLLLGD